MPVRIPFQYFLCKIIVFLKGTAVIFFIFFLFPTFKCLEFLMVWSDLTKFFDQLYFLLTLPDFFSKAVKLLYKFYPLTKL